MRALPIVCLIAVTACTVAPAQPATADAGDNPTVDAAAGVDGGSSGADAAVQSCSPIAGSAFQTLTIAGAPTDRPAAEHADLNIKLRGWTETTAPLGLVDINGPTDANAPRFASLFSPERVPQIVANHRVNNWDWGSNTAAGPITEWDVTLTTMQVTPGEVLKLPAAGYSIGSGMQALVLYADSDSITLKYTREDNIVSGYGIHLVGVCVEPSLLALYQQWNQAGRAELPALAAGQAFARANSTRLHIAVRDTGAFLDPRSRKDWWP